MQAPRLGQDEEPSTPATPAPRWRHAPWRGSAGMVVGIVVAIVLFLIAAQFLGGVVGRTKSEFAEPPPNGASAP